MSFGNYKYSVHIDGDWLDRTIENVTNIHYDTNSEKWLFVHDCGETYIKNDEIDVIDIQFEKEVEK